MYASTGRCSSRISANRSPLSGAIGGVLFFGAVFGWVTESDYTEDVLPGSDPEELEASHESYASTGSAHGH